MDTPHMFLREMVQLIPDYYSKASLIQEQHTCIDYDKEVGVTQNLTTTLPDLYSTKIKKYMVSHGRRYNW